MTGKFVWFDVSARDTDAVSQFYGKLFGWPIGPNTSDNKYAGWIMDGEQPWAGVTHADDLTEGRWLPYVQVEDLDAARDKAMALGATLIQDKTVGPGGTAVTIADPGGAFVALFVPKSG